MKFSDVVPRMWSRKKQPSLLCQPPTLAVKNGLSAGFLGLISQNVTCYMPVNSHHDLNDQQNFPFSSLHFSVWLSEKLAGRFPFNLSPFFFHSVAQWITPELLRWISFLPALLASDLPPAAMWWLLGVLSCALLVLMLTFFLALGQRYRVFSETCLRPPGPLVADSKLRDARLRRGNMFIWCCFYSGLILGTF